MGYNFAVVYIFLGAFFIKLQYIKSGSKHPDIRFYRKSYIETPNRVKTRQLALVSNEIDSNIFK